MRESLTMIEVALVGVTHCHIEGFVKRIGARDDVNVRSVWDRDVGRAAAVAKAHNTEIADLKNILKDPAVAGVVVYSETDQHQEMIARIAEAGKAMFVEKPLGLGADDAYAARDAILEAGVLFQMGYFSRGDPLLQFVREHISMGSFGKITRIRCCNAHNGALRRALAGPFEWMTDPARAGGGGYADLGTHALDVMLWLLRFSEVVEATATLGSGIGAYASGCDELGEGLMRMKDGCIGSLAASWDDLGRPLPLQVMGTEGYAYIADGKLYFKSDHVDGADGSEWTGKLPEKLPHALDIFFDHLCGRDIHPLVTVEEAAQSSAVMEALMLGAKERAWVRPAYRPHEQPHG
jgi:predicted dehydrogenase